MLQCLCRFLGHLSGNFGLLQVSFQVQDQLLLCGKLYLSEIKLLALIFSLVCDVLQPNLRTPPHPFLNSQLGGQFLFLLL